MFDNSKNGGSMLFLAGLFAGVILGFFVAGLCSITAKREKLHIERCPASLQRKIEGATVHRR
ncbi:MAG: hypothetical protein ABSG91_12505 [Syntrophobacteraceae bacterium]